MAGLMQVFLGYLEILKNVEPFWTWLRIPRFAFNH